MRDAQRLRQRLDLSLDRRQLAALTVCALLLVSAVFSLGMLIGKKAATSDVGVEFSGDLAALDAQARKEPPAALHPPKVAETTVVPAPARVATVVGPPPRATQVAPAPVTLTPPPNDLGTYTVQIGASQERSEAARLEGRARSAGLKPYVMEANLGSKGTWYRVRVGAFPDKEAANRFRKDVERELRIAAAVMPAR
jgi:cell division septation protein DedD